MRFAKLSASALVAISLIPMDAHAAHVDRKFHPVVNDDPQNAHLNVQTPGADINQTVAITAEPGPDGQVIPAGDTKVVASCAAKDTNGDIDLFGGGSCSSSAASAPIAERASVTATTIGRAASPSARAASQTARLPGLNSATVTPAANAPSRASQSVEAVRAAAPVPAHRTENALVPALPAKQFAPAVRTNVALAEFAPLRWLAMGLAAAMLAAVGLGLIFRLGLGGLLRIRREPREEIASNDIEEQGKYRPYTA